MLLKYKQRQFGWLLAVFLGFVSCAGSGGSVQTNKNIRKILKSENSFYYYLLSEVNQSHQDPEGAQALLDQALDMDPDSSFLWSQKAMDSARKTNWQEAIAMVQKSLDLDGENFDALVLMGKLHAASQKPEIATGYYKKALALNPKNEELYNILAREYLSIKQMNNAIATLKTCLVQIPENNSCVFYLASIHVEQKNYAEALKYFNMVLALNPDNSKILQTIGEIYLEKKDYTKAIEIFEQIKQIEPGDMASVIRLGLMYYERKDLDRAIAEFEYVYQKFPKSDRVNYFLGMLYQEKNVPDKAYDYFDNIESSSNFFKESLSRMMMILRQSGDPLEAVTLLEKKVEKKDQDEQYHRIRVSLLMSANDFKRALAAVDQGLATVDSEADLSFQKAIILEKLGRWEESKKLLIKLTETIKASDRVYNYLGYSILMRENNVDEALKYIDKAVELNPGDGHIIDSQAWAYFLKNDTAKALELLIKADRLTPDEPTIHEHLGDVYLKQQNKTKARFYFERAIEIIKRNPHPTNEETTQIEAIRQKLGGF